MKLTKYRDRRKRGREHRAVDRDRMIDKLFGALVVLGTIRVVEEG